MRGHCYDALVGLAGCDKLAWHDDGHGTARCAVGLLYGGSIPPGTFKGKDVTVQDLFEAVGQHAVGNMSDEDLHLLEVACPSAGSCGAQFTANTMACVSEAIGLALPHLAGAPAPYEIRDTYAYKSGEAVMRLVESQLRPRQIVTRKALENAARVVAASAAPPTQACTCPPLPMNAVLILSK